jgi:hypothetical protein
MQEHDIAFVLSEYIYKYCNDIPEYEKFKTIAKATGLVPNIVPYFEL